MGGAWYEQYLKNKSSNQILTLAYNEIKKHLNLKVEPDHQEISILKVKDLLEIFMNKILILILGSNSSVQSWSSTTFG